MKKIKKENKKSKNLKYDLILIITFFTSLIFVYSSYAWLSSSVDVTISQFKVSSESNNGLYISLDGETWSDEVELSKSNMLNLLDETYPNNNTQWADEMVPVSTIGFTDPNSNIFDFYYNTSGFFAKVSYKNKNAFDFEKYEEKEKKDETPFYAFDLFFKNVTPSPYDDNIYLNDTFKVEKNNEKNDSYASLNSVRVGFVFYDTVPIESTLKEIQNSKCNNKCHGVIYEPHSKEHDEETIKQLKKHGLKVTNGNYYNTYALYKGGKKIKIWSGVENSNVPLDTSYFALQKTNTEINQPLVSMPNGIKKARVYIWIEGQDIDIVETSSEGDKFIINLNFVKDYNSYSR